MLPEKRAYNTVIDERQYDSTSQSTQKALNVTRNDIIRAIRARIEKQGLETTSKISGDDRSRVIADETCASDNEFPPTYADSDEEEQGIELDPETLHDNNDDIDQSIWEDYKQYSDYAISNTCEFTPEMEAGIELMHILATKRVPLVLYDEIYAWHLENIEAKEKMPRSTLLKKLNKRYNMEQTAPRVVRNIIMPHSKCKVKLVVHKFREQVQSMLTDPRIKDNDMLFHGDNPFQPPPDKFTVIGDINTGLAYRETYNKLIQDPTKQVLLPIIMYMDGAVTGQYDHLPIEALKFTLGIFNANCREKVYAWRNLGYITKFLVQEHRGRDIVREHLDAEAYLTEESETESSDENSESEEEEEEPLRITKTNTGQDLHKQLSVILKSYKEVADAGGFYWKLRYKGESHDVHFIPFVIFVKGDSQEHDKHCGQYTVKTSTIAQLCRYCTCPCDETDEAYANYPPKSPAMIEKLLNKGDAAGLQALSQQNIRNAWYSLDFGAHNKLGIHGACPLELLHWIQLGKFKYSRANLFAQMGQNTILTRSIDALGKSMGILFKRQSYRGLPRTDFPKGVKEGHLMAHEMSGVILVLLCCLRCQKGKTLLLTESRGDFAEQNWDSVSKIQDWMMFLESLLQWEAWLKLPEMKVFDVRRSKTKVRELMEMEKLIGKRQAGMKFKTFNFHAVLHVAQDILNFGVPENVNTRSNEMHHKDSKTAALRTQRRAKTFDRQVAKQLHALDVVAFGLHEIQHGEPPWMYPYREDEVVTMQEPEQVDDARVENMAEEPEEVEEDDTVECTNTGVRAEFFYCEQEHQYTYKVFSKMKEKHRFQFCEQTMEKLQEILESIDCDTYKTLHLFTEHKRNGAMFRASPYYMGKPWRDWAIFNWDEDGELPGQIWIFIDLQDVPENNVFEPGIYCLIESSLPNEDVEEVSQSSILVPYIKGTRGLDDDGNLLREFWTIPVDSIVETACLIPDIGNEDPCAFLRVLPTELWADQFINWLRLEHTRECD